MPDLTTADPRRSVAVIGSGVAGLTAAYLLGKRDRVTLYEADDRLGGHAHTHHITQDNGVEIDVDTGFIVHNDRTYPTLLRLFAELGVVTQESDMSMSVRSDVNGLEYAGAKGLPGLFPKLRNVAKPRYLKMLTEVTKFHRAARAVLDATDAAADEPLGDFLSRNRFSDFFVDHFMTPLVAAVWSCDPRLASHYPARYLFAFLDHHGMLSVTGSPTWRTVTGGSARYVEKVAQTLDEIRTGTPVVRVDRAADGVEIVDAAGARRSFDAVVIAVHPQHALAMLGDPSETESAVLGAMPYSVNTATLHTDTSVLPRAPRARASWNYLIPATATDGVIVSYDMTRLMKLDSGDDRRYVVTLGGSGRIDPAAVLAEMTYEHPIYTPESVAAQRQLSDLATDTVAFAGAYHGWGFHEDGALSGLRAAERLGANWERSAILEPAT